MPKEEFVILRGALRDIKRDIARLGRLKNTSEKEEKLIKEILNSTKSKEMELRNQISILIEQEAKLNKKRGEIERDISEIQERLNKVKNIKDQIEGSLTPI